MTIQLFFFKWLFNVEDNYILKINKYDASITHYHLDVCTFKMDGIIMLKKMSGENLSSSDDKEKVCSTSHICGSLKYNVRGCSLNALGIARLPRLTMSKEGNFFFWSE